MLDAFEQVGAPAAEEAGTARSLAELFLDYAGNYLSRGPLCWSPGQIAVFLGTGCPARRYSIRHTALFCPLSSSDG